MDWAEPGRMSDYFIYCVNISTVNNSIFSYFMPFFKKKCIWIRICDSNHSLRIVASGWNFPLARKKQAVWIIDITIHVGKKIVENSWDLSNDSFSISRTPRYSFSWLCLTDIPWSEKNGLWDHINKLGKYNSDLT